MESGQNQGTGGNLIYQLRYEGEDWLTMDRAVWVNYLRLDFFNHEMLVDALEKNPGKVKTQGNKKYRMVKDGDYIE